MLGLPPRVILPRSSRTKAGKISFVEVAKALESPAHLPLATLGEHIDAVEKYWKVYEAMRGGVPAPGIGDVNQAIAAAVKSNKDYLYAKGESGRSFVSVAKFFGPWAESFAKNFVQWAEGVAGEAGDGKWDDWWQKEARKNTARLIVDGWPSWPLRSEVGPTFAGAYAYSPWAVAVNMAQLIADYEALTPARAEAFKYLNRVMIANILDPRALRLANFGLDVFVNDQTDDGLPDQPKNRYGEIAEWSAGFGALAAIAKGVDVRNTQINTYRHMLSFVKPVTVMGGDGTFAVETYNTTVESGLPSVQYLDRGGGASGDVLTFRGEIAKTAIEAADGKWDAPETPSAGSDSGGTSTAVVVAGGLGAAALLWWLL